MSWESSRSFRRTFTTGTSHQLIFKAKFLEAKSFDKSKIIGLTITRANKKHKLAAFACKG